MKRAILFVALILAVGFGFAVCGNAADKPAKKSAKGKLRHVVLMKLKDGTKPKQIKAIEDGFAALPSKISVIRDFEWGTDVSVENLSQGFTHCFLVTFDDAKGRDVYLPHPAHKKFVKLVMPHIDKVLVVDYVAK